MKYFRRALSGIIAIFFCVSTFTGTATATENNQLPIDATVCQTNPIELTSEQQKYFKYVDDRLTITLLPQ